MTPRQPRDTATICNQCGWVSKTTTSCLAAYALTRHSCDKYRREQASAERGRALQARIDRTPQPCLHKRANHQHGHYATYVLDRCRCWPCVEASTGWKRNQTRKQAQGRWQPYVDAAPARRHLIQLSASGMGWKRVAEQAGLSSSVVCSLLYGKGERRPSQKVRRETAEAVLAVRLDLAPGTLVDATGTWRRLQALVAIGWPRQHLAARLYQGGARGLQFHKIRVQLSTAEKVKNLYEELQNTPGPSARARNDAIRKGWLHPGWWDPDTIDNPDYHPPVNERAPRQDEVDEVAVMLAAAGQTTRRLTPAERRELVQQLHAQGLNDLQISRRTGMAPETARRIRTQLHLPARLEQTA